MIAAETFIWVTVKAVKTFLYLILFLILLKSEPTGLELNCNKANKFIMQQFKYYCNTLKKPEYDEKCGTFTLEVFCEQQYDHNR